MKYLLVLLIGVLTSAMLPSCIDDDFSTSSHDILTFSSDTLSFDTIFTEQGTPTARLKVYNRASKAIRISSIAMKEPASLFAMNVDGESGSRFTDVEIRGGDSIFIFVECRLPENPSSTPLRVKDAIVFETNGVIQEVALEAWGQNVTRLKAVSITADTRFTSEQPYVVYDSLIVERGATLTIEPGTQLLFHDKASLTVRGRLLALGEAGKKIDMHGDRLDDVLPDVGYDILAGQWHGITIAPESFGNRMEYVDMRSTVQGLVVDSCANVTDQKLLLVNSWLHNSQENVLTSSYSRVDAYGCCFSEAGNHVVSLTGGIYDFTQCTFSNYYLFAGNWRTILGLYHCLPSDTMSDDQPLMQAQFRNGIIYGMTAEINVGDLSDSQVYMHNMLFGVGGSNDNNFIDCIWDADPLFYTVREDYIFNYHVQPESPAIGIGDPSFITPLCRYDMDGVDRLSDGNPTVGAYQYVAPVQQE